MFTDNITAIIGFRRPTHRGFSRTSPTTQWIPHSATPSTLSRNRSRNFPLRRILSSHRMPRTSWRAPHLCTTG